MKTFVVTVFAILAAAAVTAAFLAAKSRVDKWIDAKNQYVAEISSLYKTANNLSAQSIFPLSERSTSIRRMSDAINRMWRVELDLRSLLENKPFRLPLSKSESKLLDNTRTDIEELKRILSPPDATPSAEPNKADEKESFDNLLQTIHKSAAVAGDTRCAFLATQEWKNRMQICSYRDWSACLYRLLQLLRGVDACSRRRLASGDSELKVKF